MLLDHILALAVRRRQVLLALSMTKVHTTVASRLTWACLKLSWRMIAVTVMSIGLEAHLLAGCREDLGTWVVWLSLHLFSIFVHGEVLLLREVLDPRFVILIRLDQLLDAA